MDSWFTDHPTALAGFVQQGLVRWFSQKILGRAANYRRDSSVLAVDYDPYDGVLYASVQGSERAPYELTVFLPQNRNDELSSTCDCPYGDSCKHAAAATLVWLQLVLSRPASATSTSTAAIQSGAGDAWLRQAEALLKASAQAAAKKPVSKPPVLQAMHYVLRALPSGQPELLAVKRRLRVDGSVGSDEAWNNFHQAFRNPPGFADDADLLVFGSVARLLSGPGSYYASQQPVTLAGKGADHALRLLLATGRLHWGNAQGPLLQLGEPQDLAPSWQAQAGQHRAVLSLGQPAPGSLIELLVAHTPWVVRRGDNGCTELCPVRSELPADWLLLLAKAPALSEAQATRLKLLVGEGSRLPLPAVSVAPLVELAPVPVLQLFVIRPDPKARGRQLPPRLVLRPGFDYGGAAVELGSDASLVELPSAAGDQRYARRRPDLEQAALASLDRLGAPAAPRPGWHPGGRVGDRYWDQQDAALDFQLIQVPALTSEGWKFDYADDWPLRPIEASDFQGAFERSGTDWFELHLTAAVGPERIDVPGLLARALGHYGVERLREMLSAATTGAGASAASEPRILCPADGRLIALPLSRVRAMLALMLELFDGGGLAAAQAPRLSRFDLARLSNLADDSGGPWAGGEAAQQLGRRLRDFHGIAAVPTPRELRATLRDYQQQGLAWMQFLREYGFAGVLADEMGLGKTVQTLAHVLAEQAAGRLKRPALVVAPTSVLPNWEREVARFAPTLRVLTISGAGRLPLFERIGEHDLILTSYPLLARDAERWLPLPFHLVVLDEAQTIKNAKTQAAQVACGLQAGHRLALTGTPMENHLGEIWSLFQFLMPGFLGDEKRFERVYRRPIEKGGDALRRDALASRLAPFMLRRTKERVAGELPPKLEMQHSVRFEARQRELYETVRAAMDEKVRRAVSQQGLARSRIAILDALLKLRQVCCDPRLLPAGRDRAVSETAVKAAGSAKLDALMELLGECRDSERRVLVFSQFTGMLDLIEPRLAAAKLSFVRLDGGTRDRVTPVARFQAGEADVFLISLKAGGTGLNLTAADTVIHYDPWWNPAVEAQATGRAHRIGQDKPVFAYRLVCEGSIEEKIMALQGRKAQLAADLLDGGAHDSTAISAEDLQSLLAPLA